MDPARPECENVNMAPVKKQLGPLGHHFLKEWREFNQLDQDSAATRLDISRTLLSKIEGQKSPYSQRILEAAAEVYECTPAQLLCHNPLDPSSFAPLLEAAEKLEGPHREQVRDILVAALRVPGG